MKAMSRRPHRGFSLLELSISLVVIAIILSMVSSGRSVLFGAKATASYWTFVQDWKASFQEFRRRTNAFPADSLTNPTGHIKKILHKSGVVPPSSQMLCNGNGGFELSDTFLKSGVTLPEREARPKRPDIMLYTDDEGIGHTATMCMLTHEKSVPGTSVGSSASVAKPALLITDLHYSMAQQIDLLMDGSLSTRFGSVRVLRFANNSGTPNAGEDCWGDAASGCSGAFSSGRTVALIIFLE